MRLFVRVRLLVTGRAHWTDQETGETVTTREDWGTRWALAGPHSFRWWWVKRWGRMGCGCTRNPLTRRIVLFRIDCPEWPHGFTELGEF